MNKRSLPLRLLAAAGLLLSAAHSRGQSDTAPAVHDLAACIRYAQEHNPALAKRRIDYDTQRLTTLAERARFDIHLDAAGSRALESGADNGSLTLSREFLSGFDLSATMRSMDTGDGDLGSFSAILSKQILGSGSALETRNPVDRSLVDETIRLNDLNKESRQVGLAVRREFYQVVRNLQTARIQNLRLERAKQNLEHARVRDENPLDIVRAEVEVPANEVQVLSASRQIDSALDRLKVTMGLLPQDNLALDVDFAFALAVIDVEADVAHAWELHEDFLNNDLERVKLEWDVRIARQQLWPDVDVFTRYDRASEERYRLDGDDDVTVGLAVHWEIGRRGDRARARIAANQIDRNAEDRYILQQEKAATLRDLGRRIAESALSIQLQEERVQLNERLVELYRDRWENGEIEILEFIRSQNDLEDSRVQLINQKTQYLDLAAEYAFEARRDEILTVPGEDSAD